MCTTGFGAHHDGGPPEAGTLQFSRTRQNEEHMLLSVRTQRRAASRLDFPEIDSQERISRGAVGVKLRDLRVRSHHLRPAS